MRTRELRLGWFFRRGDIYLANLNPFTGSEQGGTRPVLVLQNNDGNFYYPTLIVAPMTTQMTISLSWPALSDSLWNMVVSTSSLTS